MNINAKIKTTPVTVAVDNQDVKKLKQLKKKTKVSLSGICSQFIKEGLKNEI